MVAPLPSPPVDRTEERPGYIIRDLAGLYEAYPEIDNDGGTYRCGNASATVAGDAIHISGPKDDLDSWRAACAAWWAARPDADGYAIRFGGHSVRARVQ